MDVILIIGYRKILIILVRRGIEIYGELSIIPIRCIKWCLIILDKYILPYFWCYARLWSLERIVAIH